MSTIDHVTIRVGDLAEAMVFYDRVFNLLGFTGQCYEAEPFFEWGDFSLAQADPEHPPTTGLHIAFTADSQELVESWWLGADRCWVPERRRTGVAAAVQPRLLRGLHPRFATGTASKP